MNNKTQDELLDQIEEAVTKIFSGDAMTRDDFRDAYVAIYNIHSLYGRKKLVPRIENLLEQQFTAMKEKLRQAILAAPCEMDDQSVQSILSNSDRALQVFAYDRRKYSEGFETRGLRKQIVLNDDVISKYLIEHQIQMN